MQVSYSGYYASLPRMTRRFNSDHLLYKIAKVVPINNQAFSSNWLERSTKVESSRFESWGAYQVLQLAIFYTLLVLTV